MARGPSRSGPAAPRPIDARVRRTRDALGDALVELMHSKPFDAITVQDVLDRAGVGRSTFYTHYRDKDDLFLSDVEEFFGAMSGLVTRCDPHSRRVAPVRELFAHVAEMRAFRAALVASGRMRDVEELGTGLMARGIAERLAALGADVAATPRAALAHALAGALFSLLSWWLARGTPGTPAQMDALYRQMVWRGAAPPERADARAPLAATRSSP